MTIQQIKQRFGIIGNSPELNRAIDIASQVAPTDLTVLVTGASGVGKEIFSQIIHKFSARKHGSYIAVNCGAIPEGTIDSELFGHEKGAFTGANDSRKGYFEVADKGTIFLDEVGELPLSTQVRLLRVIEAGEFIKVGSSKIRKTDVRIIAATNRNFIKAIEEGKFREDLYYRLSTVPISVPALRKRKEDITLLFRKFAQDFSEKYRMPPVRLTENAQKTLLNYRWPGNIRQLKNVTEQISIIEQERIITGEILSKYLPAFGNSNLPALYSSVNKEEFSSEREILYKILFDMRNEINELKSIVNEFAGRRKVNIEPNNDFFNTENNYTEEDVFIGNVQKENLHRYEREQNNQIEDTEEIVEESLSIRSKEIELIKKALAKHKNKRKYAAEELEISERTLYRKIKEYSID